MGFAVALVGEDCEVRDAESEGHSASLYHALDIRKIKPCFPRLTNPVVKPMLPVLALWNAPGALVCFVEGYDVTTVIKTPQLI